MTPLHRTISDTILRAKIQERDGSIQDTIFVSSSRSHLERALEEALELEDGQLYLIALKEEDKPRNRGSFFRVWIASAAEIIDIIRQPEWSAFTIIFPKTAQRASIDLGPDHEGGFELNVNEYGDNSISGRINLILKLP